ncbi:MAG: hypothetical protein INR69_12340 [Mucilaginibacter polytrichastri]|nr:hypothetical protein [Mucilaginibacter polytrichastri]
MLTLKLLLQISASLAVLSAGFIIKISADLYLIRHQSSATVGMLGKGSFRRYAAWLYMLAPAAVIIALIFLKSPFIGLISDAS